MDVLFLKNTRQIQYAAKDDRIEQRLNGGCRNILNDEDPKGSRAQCQEGNVEWDPFAGDLQKTVQDEEKVYQMGDQKAEKVPIHSVNGQEEKQKDHIQGGSDDVVVYADLLLPIRQYT